jgi:uncharacterized protein involved in propanediol utilization
LGAVLLLLIAYWFSFRKTSQAHHQNKNLTQQTKQIQSANFTIQQLQQQLAKTKINHPEGSGPFNQTVLFEKVSHFCESNQLNILTFDEPKIVQTDDYEVTTNYMEIEGQFNSITALVYELEQKLRLGRMASVHYELDFDRKTKQFFLIGKIYLQNIQNKK